VVQSEFALLDVLVGNRTLTPKERQSEFKSSNFFEEQSDDVKVDILRGLCRAIAPFDVSFLIGHAFCRSDSLQSLGSVFGTPQRMIQWLAYGNVAFLLAPHTERGIVQVIIDLGLSESFKPMYDMYVGTNRGLLAVRQMGISEELITLPNFRNLPVPLFIDSRDSRLVQLSDVIVGLKLAEKCPPVSDFKSRLIGSINDIGERITVHSAKHILDSAYYAVAPDKRCVFQGAANANHELTRTSSPLAIRPGQRRFADLPAWVLAIHPLIRGANFSDDCQSPELPCP